MLKGFIIFLTATFWFVSWSRAELRQGRIESVWSLAQADAGRGADAPDEAKRSHADRLEIRVSSRDGGQRARDEGRGTRDEAAAALEAHLDVISNVVPKIWARTNSAMIAVCGASRRCGDRGCRRSSEGDGTGGSEEA